jgi:hypothetical protein
LKFVAYQLLHDTTTKFKTKRASARKRGLVDPFQHNPLNPKPMNKVMSDEVKFITLPSLGYLVQWTRHA